MKYFIKTFGCQQNVADSERVEAALRGRGMTPAKGYKDANYVVINTCMVRESAENRVYGLVNNLAELKRKKKDFKIIVTGCMVGVAFRDASGQYLKKLKRILPDVDEFMPIEEVGFDHAPIRTNATSAWVPISNGCNNFCTFCIVPFTRGREISRPYQDIIEECRELKEKGFTKVTLLGQNVNSYGSDLVLGKENIQVMRDLPGKNYFKDADEEKATEDSTDGKVAKGKTTSTKIASLIVDMHGQTIKPVYVRHLGRQRIPTLFPNLLNDVASMGFATVDFISSNPWDFSDELIDVIARNPNITRTIHLPVQHGNSVMLRRMNRWYTREEYLKLIKKIRAKVPGVQFTTDIIVGFCGETPEEFASTVALCNEVGFSKAYISIYSPRPITAATKVMTDNVPHPVKEARWQELNQLVNKK